MQVRKISHVVAIVTKNYNMYVFKFDNAMATDNIGL